MALLDKISTILARAFPETQIKPTTTTETGISEGERFGGIFGQIGRFVYDQSRVEQTRFARYRDYELMDNEFPELSSALDIYADNSTFADREPFETFQFEIEEENIKEFLNEVTERTGIKDDIWTIARDIVKYGEDFNELVFNASMDLIRLKCLDRYITFRVEDEFGRLDPEAAFIQRDPQTQREFATFKDWQVVHFRARKSRGTKYGESIFRSARRVFRQLQLMEDGMVIGRLSRAHMRYAFMIDTQGLVGDEALIHLDNIKRRFRKRRFINPKSGKMEIQDNPLHAEDDIWLPQGELGKSDVKILQGQANLGNIGDVEYFRNKMFAATKVPKAFLALEMDTRARAVITELDVQFARSVRRFQMVMGLGLKKVYDRAMIAKGIKIPKYRIMFPPISTVDEIREWTVEKLKADIARIWGKQINVLSTEYMLRTYLGLTDDEIAQMEIEKTQPPDEPTPGPSEGLPSPAEVYADARLANTLETLRDLVEWELDGKRFYRVKEGRQANRMISLPSGNGAGIYVPEVRKVQGTLRDLGDHIERLSEATPGGESIALDIIEEMREGVREAQVGLKRIRNRGPED